MTLKQEILDLGGSAELFNSDFKQQNSIDTLFDLIEKKVGHLDVLVNSASLFERVPFEEIEDFESTFLVNLLAPLKCAQRAAKIMNKHSNIIHICDTTALYPIKHRSLHSISKSALLSSTKALAKELSPQIRVNTLLLGPVMPDKNCSKVSFDHLCEKHIMMKRAVDLGAITHALHFLIDNNYITASVLSLDGGYF